MHGKKTKLSSKHTSMTVKQLKIQLRKHGLSQKGKKADLYERLTNHISTIGEECAPADETPERENDRRRGREQSAAILRQTIISQSSREGYEDALNPDQLELIAEDPLACTFETSDNASPLVMACAYGKIGIVGKMLAAGANFNNEYSGRRSALTWAVLLECDDKRVLGQECGDECNLCCVYDNGGCILANQMHKKLAIVKTFGPQCNIKIIEDALAAAKVQLKSFQDNFDYHQEDALDGGPEEDVEHAEYRVMEVTEFVSALTQLLEKKVKSAYILLHFKYSL